MLPRITLVNNKPFLCAPDLLVNRNFPDMPNFKKQASRVRFSLSKTRQKMDMFQ